MMPAKKKKEQKTPWKSGTKRMLILLGSAVLVAVLAAGSYFIFRKPRPKSDKVEDIVKFAASSDFNKLSSAERQAYLRKMRPQEGQRRPPSFSNMTQEERSGLRENMMRLFEQERNRQMRKYFALKTQEEKNAFLDEEIAKMEQRRAEMQKRMEEWRRNNAQRNQNNAANANPQRQRPSESEMAARTRSRVESTSPESRAMRNQYMRELQARAKQTGKNIGGPGGGGGRPGGRPGR